MEHKSKFNCVYSSISEDGEMFCMITYSKCIKSCEFKYDCKHCLDKRKCPECVVSDPEL